MKSSPVQIPDSVAAAVAAAQSHKAVQALEKQSNDSRFGGEVHAPVSDFEKEGQNKLESLDAGEIEKIYKLAFGFDLTDKQKVNLFNVANMLELKPDDGIWTVLLALENYQRLYLQAPWNIVEAVRKVIQEVKDETAAMAARAVAEEKAELAKIARQQKGRVSKTLIACLVGSISFSVLSIACSATVLKFCELWASGKHVSEGGTIFKIFYRLFT